MQLDDLLAQRQAQTGSAFLAPDTDEGLEDPGLLAIGDAFAVVLHPDDHSFGMPPRMQPDAPIVGGMTERVVQQIVQHPVQLRGVCRDAW